MTLFDFIADPADRAIAYDALAAFRRFADDYSADDYPPNPPLPDSYFTDARQLLAMTLTSDDLDHILILELDLDDELRTITLFAHYTDYDPDQPRLKFLTLLADTDYSNLPI